MGLIYTTSIEPLETLLFAEGEVHTFTTKFLAAKKEMLASVLLPMPLAPSPPPPPSPPSPPQASSPFVISPSSTSTSQPTIANVLPVTSSNNANVGIEGVYGHDSATLVPDLATASINEGVELMTTNSSTTNV
uniref:Uncharacterized protein n=1 Tax=Lygus hesperus TaxID=30085 RepID=A0A0A9Y0X1_LYGHE